MLHIICKFWKPLEPSLLALLFWLKARHFYLFDCVLGLLSEFCSHCPHSSFSNIQFNVYLLSCFADIAFVDRADIKAYVGPPTLQARYEILRSCLHELLRSGILKNLKVLIFCLVLIIQFPIALQFTSSIICGEHE